MHFFKAFVAVSEDLIALVGAGEQGFAGSTDLTAIRHSGGVTTRRRFAGLVAVVFSALLAIGGQALAASPSVTSISPNSGQYFGPNLSRYYRHHRHRLYGRYLGGDRRFSATILSVDSDTQITVRAPAGVAGVADVIVLRPAATPPVKNLYTYFSGSPSISVVGPNFGLTTGGNTIFITGNNFIAGPGATTVSIGGHLATGVTVSLRRLADGNRAGRHGGPSRMSRSPRLAAVPGTTSIRTLLRPYRW